MAFAAVTNDRGSAGLRASWTLKCHWRWWAHIMAARVFSTAIDTRMLLHAGLREWRRKKAVVVFDGAKSGGSLFRELLNRSL